MRSIFAIAAALLSLSQAAPLVEKRENNFVGELTYYDPGLGSCGLTHGGGDPVVALAVGMMQNPANPNVNPLCGQTITVLYNGVRTTATIADTCWGCAQNDIDVSPTLFRQIAPNGDGRVPGVTWWFNSTPDGGRP